MNKDHRDQPYLTTIDSLEAESSLQVSVESEASMATRQKTVRTLIKMRIIRIPTIIPTRTLTAIQMAAATTKIPTIQMSTSDYGTVINLVTKVKTVERKNDLERRNNQNANGMMVNQEEKRSEEANISCNEDFCTMTVTQQMCKSDSTE